MCRFISVHRQKSVPSKRQFCVCVCTFSVWQYQECVVLGESTTVNETPKVGTGQNAQIENSSVFLCFIFCSNYANFDEDSFISSHKLKLNWMSHLRNKILCQKKEFPYSWIKGRILPKNPEFNESKEFTWKGPLLTLELFHLCPDNVLLPEFGFLLGFTFWV